ncbi:hypothetical protein A4X06_0g7344 [Tilletia controversa]|uniref:Cyclin-like domain-containing protein n=1 Tax=Tilletia controversa TaxID=13291 RepID=A0A8X7MMC4_9BASI|nr:hypothetical protein CF328_g529 [Tilletia controversa]KAE8241935.1 hypothetical protein A4X06_0g7344 [Tilletia controversa]
MSAAPAAGAAVGGSSGSSRHAHAQHQQQQQQQQQQEGQQQPQQQQQPQNMEQLYMQQQRTTLTAGPGQSIVTRAHYAYLTPAEYSSLNEHMRKIAIQTHTLAAFSAHTHQSCGLIEGTASRLGFPRRTIATAQLLYTRFHLTYSPSDFLLHEVSLACLVLSSKICDTPKRTREMIVTSYALRYPEKCRVTSSLSVPAHREKEAMEALSAGRESVDVLGGGSSSSSSARPRAPSGFTAPQPPPVAPSRLMGTISESDIDPARIENERGRILAIERLLLETTSFNFQVRAQSSLALSFKLGRRLRAPKDLCDSAWRIAADAHRSAAPLIYPPLTIALASLYLAALFAFPPLKSAVDSAHTDEADRVADQQYYAYFDPRFLEREREAAAVAAASASASAMAGSGSAGMPPRGIQGASIIGSSARSIRAATSSSTSAGQPSSSQSSSSQTAVAAAAADAAAAAAIAAMGEPLQGVQREAARLIMCFTASDGLFGDASMRPGGANRAFWKAQCRWQQVNGLGGRARKRRKVWEGGAEAGVGKMDVDGDKDGQGKEEGEGEEEVDALADEALWLALGSSSGVGPVENAAVMILDLYIESLRLLSSSPPFSGPMPVQPAHLAAGTTTSNTIVTSAKVPAPTTNTLSDDPAAATRSPQQVTNGAALEDKEEKGGMRTTVVLVNTRQAPMPPSYALSPPPLEILHVLNHGYALAMPSGTGTTTGTAAKVGRGSGPASSSSQSTPPLPSPLELLQELDQLKLWLLRIGRRRDRADTHVLASRRPPHPTTTTASTEHADGEKDEERERERHEAEEFARRRWETAEWRRWSASVAQSMDDGRMRGIVPEDPTVRARLVGKGPVEYKPGVVRFLF